MTTATLTLTDFLLARIAEDEENPPDTDTWAGYVEGLSSEDWARINSEQARWEQRWAAEVEAKRRIVEFYAGPHGTMYVLHFLALPYADHPDFREEWRR